MAVALVLTAAGWLVWQRHDSPPANASVASTKSAAPKPPSTPGFDKTKYSTSNPTSIWVVVNKPRPLNPPDYVPPDLVMPAVPLRVPGNESMQVRKVTADALATMFAAARRDNVVLMLSSGYRSYSYQVNLYNGYVASQGQAAADQASARPGHSEHQTGLAADIEPADRQCEIETCFATTLAGQWLAVNAWKYGFIIRYPADKVAITGYEYEPWHVRYVGVDLSTEMHNSGVETLEEFFGLPGGPNY